MTKKHFIELADYLRKPGMVPAAVYGGIATAQANHSILLTDEQSRAIAQEVLKAVTGELADFCNSQNARFDRNLWMDYIAGKCGPGGGKVKE